MSGQAFHQLIEEPGSWPMAAWWPEAAGLAVAVFSTATVLPGDTMPALSWIEIWSLATRCTVPVFAATAAAVYGACRMVAAREAADTAIGTACAASWFPPLVLFFRHNSAWTAVVAAALAILATRAILLGRGPASTEPSMLPAVLTALGLQTGAAAAAVGDWRAAAVPLTIAAVLLAWMLTARGVWPRRRLLGERRLRVVPAFCLAVLFSAGGLTPHLEESERRGGWTDFLRALFGASGSGTAEPELPDPRRSTEETATPAVIMGESYPAVILWPESEPFTTLVPPPPASPHALFAGRAPDAYGLPFSGYYLFRRAGFRQPKQAYRMRGDPARTTLRTTDLSRLIMEAHQDFSTPIAMNCCRHIEIVSRVEDARPDTILLELIVRDRAAPGKPWESLGTARLKTATRFDFPARPRLRQFDQATLRFHLAAARYDRSARAAIRRFLFVR